MPETTETMIKAPVKASDAGADIAAGKSQVEIRNIAKSYGEDWAVEQVIEDLSFTVPPGELTVIVGPSGCGKSTLVNLIAGFVRPESGEILLDGKPVSGPARDRMVVFQESALLPWQTAYENIVFGPKLRGDLKGDELRERAENLLIKVGLGEFMHKYPIQLSGGMQRRAELARALINEPRILVMDEPFRGLDAMSRGLMQEFFLELFDENRRTNLFVTSEIDEAIFLADSVVVLSNQPAHVRKVIRIDLPRPRDYKMLSSPEAFEYKRDAMEILHEEAMRSFKDGAGSDIAAAYAKLRDADQPSDA